MKTGCLGALPCVTSRPCDLLGIAVVVAMFTIQPSCSDEELAVVFISSSGRCCRCCRCCRSSLVGGVHSIATTLGGVLVIVRLELGRKGHCLAEFDASLLW